MIKPMEKKERLLKNIFKIKRDKIMNMEKLTNIICFVTLDHELFCVPFFNANHCYLKEGCSHIFIFIF